MSFRQSVRIATGQTCHRANGHASDNGEGLWQSTPATDLRITVGRRGQGFGPMRFLDQKDS